MRNYISNYLATAVATTSDLAKREAALGLKKPSDGGEKASNSLHMLVRWNSEEPLITARKERDDRWA